MTNYNERLEEILSKTPCSQCDGSGAYPDYDGEPVQCQFCWQLRFTFIDNTKQAITSLMKELVAEAKPDRQPPMKMGNPTKESSDLDKMIFAKKKGHNEAIDQFEQNLLKELEEV